LSNVWRPPVVGRPWDDILRHYERIEGDSFRPMCELVRRIAESPYSTGLHAITSMHTLLVSNTPGFDFDFECLRIDWDPDIDSFLLEFVEEPFVRKRWRKRVPRADGFAALERFVRRKGWFVEYGTTIDGAWEEHMDTNPPGAAGPQGLHGLALSASLTVGDLRRSLAWYRDALGFAVDREFERGGALTAVSLRAGEVRVLLAQDDGAKGADRARGEGFSLMITTDQDVDAIARRVREAGGTLDSEPADTPWGMRAFRLRDPDGFRLTISSGGRAT
jgi:uncharacterized glyoxalase superfamily protein PhnB